MIRNNFSHRFLQHNNLKVACICKKYRHTHTQTHKHTHTHTQELSCSLTSQLYVSGFCIFNGIASSLPPFSHFLPYSLSIFLPYSLSIFLPYSLSLSISPVVSLSSPFSLLSRTLSYRNRLPHPLLCFIGLKIQSRKNTNYISKVGRGGRAV